MCAAQFGKSKVGTHFTARRSPADFRNGAEKSRSIEPEGDESPRHDLPARPITIKVWSEWAGVNDAGGAGAVVPRLALGAGEQPSIHRDPPTPKAMAGEAGTTGLRTQGAVIFNGPGRRMVRWGRREAAGSPVSEGSRASGIRHWGGIEYNSSCGWGRKHPS